MITAYDIYSDSNSWNTNWHHIAVTWGSGGMKMFIDGVLQTDTDAYTGYTPSGDLDNIGASTYHDYSFDGIIDEVRFSNTARYTTDFTPSTAPFTSNANTVALYHFDIDGYDNSTHVYDSSGNGNNGTINGAYHTDGKIVPNAEADNTIYFATQKNISAGGADSNYYLYYNNPSAGITRDNRSNVYLLYDDFDIFDTTNVWNTESSSYGSYDVSGGILHVWNIIQHEYGVWTKSPYGYADGYQITWRITDYDGPTADADWAIAGSGVVASGGWRGTSTDILSYRNQNGDSWKHRDDNNIRLSESLPNVPFIYKIKRYGGQYKSYIDDTLKVTQSYTGSQILYPGIDVGSGSPSNADSDVWADWVYVSKYISPEPTSSLKTQQNQTNMTESYQLTTTIYNPSQIELTNITAIAVIGNNTYTQTTPYSISQGQYLTINTNASEGDIKKIRISALNCPVYIEALDVGRCE